MSRERSAVNGMEKSRSLFFQEISEIKVLIRGGGEMASGIAHRLFRCGFHLCLTETAQPLAVRRPVSFSEAVFDGTATVEDVIAQRIEQADSISSCWDAGKIPLLIDPENNVKNIIRPHVIVDAIMAKRNLGTKHTDAPLVIGLGPGFTAGLDVHIVVETNRGHNLGRLIFEGQAESDTRIPGSIEGYGVERVLRAPGEGIFATRSEIGERVSKGDTVGMVGEKPVVTKISGVVRGLLRHGTGVTKGLKLGDIDPRGDRGCCGKVSDKARTLGGSVLEGILTMLPTP